MNFPVFRTTWEILEFCWVYRNRVILYGAIPVAITAVLNIAAWLAGADLTDPRNPAVVGLSLVNAIVFLPFTVTWYRSIILGDQDLATRPLFTLTRLEGQMLVWQIIIVLIVIVVGLAGALLISAVLGVLSSVLGAASEPISAAGLGLWGVVVIAVLCRLSLVLAMAATGRPVVLGEAWAKTRGLGARMAAIFVLCLLSVIALVVPMQFIVVVATTITGLLVEAAAESVGTVLEILLGVVASMLVYLFPATLFAFVYNRISEAMDGTDHTGRTAGQIGDTSADTALAPPQTGEDEVATVLQRLGAYLADKPRETTEDMRSLLDGLFGQFPIPDDVTLETIEANGVPARWVSASDANPNKVILYLHGGGFTAGSLLSHQRLASDLSTVSGARVLLVDYRLAPEHPYPAGLDDCVIAYRWLLESGFKPGHIAIMGDSAGGGLTMSTAMRLKDEGLDQPAALVTLSPWVNLACDGETMDTKAAEDPITSREDLLRPAAEYLNGYDAKDPMVSPIHGDLRGLPPLLIQVGTREVLLDDSRKLAVRAHADEVTVTAEEWSGMFHVWHMMAERLTDGRRALGGVGAFIRRHMG